MGILDLVLVIGSGGREHALAAKLETSPLVGHVYLWPGNAGVASNTDKTTLVGTDISDHGGILDFCLSQKISLVVVGPEAALAAGLADELMRAQVKVLGPTRSAAQLESSKYFAKKIMEGARIPTAPYSSFTDLAEALRFIDNTPWGNEMVVKADALAAGKGVVVCRDRQEAREAVQSLLSDGKRIIIEKKLQGREVSAFALCDGQDFVTLGWASDYKRIFDGDKGANTGGMGAISPVPWAEGTYRTRVEREIFAPLLRAMNERGQPFRGILFAGLMIDQGAPRDEDINVLEFNVRLGDPETQVLLPRLDEDLYPWLLAAATGDLARMTVNGRKLGLKRQAAVHVVMAAEGYPSSKLRSGDSILLAPQTIPANVFHGGQGQIFFSGVKASLLGGGSLQTGGGRVLGVTALGEDLQGARKLAYELTEKITFSGAQFRRDIGDLSDKEWGQTEERP